MKTLINIILIGIILCFFGCQTTTYEGGELDGNHIIGSVSFGGTRKFRLRNKKNKKLIHNIELVNGSLLIMSELTQQYWEHEIPKTKKKVAERINLTFRSIL